MMSELENVRLASNRFGDKVLARIARANGFTKTFKLSGDEANVSEFDDYGEEFYLILSEDEHDGHIVRVETAKYNCGAYSETHHCDCGAYYQNHMNGCWQQGHQRDQEGTPLV